MPAKSPSGKLGFVTSELFPVTRGGAAVFHFQIARELIRRGHRVSILLDAAEEKAAEFRAGGELSKFAEPSRLQLFTICQLLGSPDPEMSQTSSWYLAKSRQWFFAVREFLSRQELDVLEFPDFYGFGHTAVAAHRWMNLWPRTRFVVRSHLTMEQIQEPEIGCYVDRTALLMHEQERAALADCDAVLAPSASYARQIAGKYSIPENKIVLSPLPVGELPAPANPAANRDTVLFIARLFHFKGADIFVDAAVRLLETNPQFDPRVRFVLIGYDGKMAPGNTSFQAYLRRRIPARLADRFEFTGQLPPDRVGEWLHRSICYVCPSRTESFAYSVHEAVAAGTPVILADLPGFTDLFEHSVNCLKFDGGAADLAEKIVRLVNDEPLRKKLSQSHPPAAVDLAEPYERLAALPIAPIVSEQIALPRILVVILESAAANSGEFPATADAVAQAWPGAQILKLSPADANSSATLPLLGKLWNACGPTTTADLLMICMSGDRFDAEYLRQAAAAFARNPELGFIAPLATAGSPQTTGAAVDLELPVWPMLRDAALTRSIMRTESGHWLADLLDRRVEAYGELAYLWSIQDRGQAGLQWPAPCAALCDNEFKLDDPGIFQSLLLRNASKNRMKLQSRFLAQTTLPAIRPLITETQLAAQRIYHKLRGMLRGN
jgi:glycosyltransferase involved in cell wall biosynthesis